MGLDSVGRVSDVRDELDYGALVAPQECVSRRRAASALGADQPRVLAREV